MYGLDFLGDDAAYFMKSSWQIYTDVSGARQYIGKTTMEKTFSPNIELAEFWDNSGGTQTLFVLDIDKFDFNMSFGLMQVADPATIPIAWNMELDTSDPDYIFMFGGSAPQALAEAEWRCVGKSRTGLEIMLVIRRGVCVPNGDWTVGTAGDYTNLPVTIRALQDTTITNAKRDMVYFRVQRKALS